MEMPSIQPYVSENWPKAWSFAKPHLKDAVRLVVAVFAEKVAQSARGETAR
jgi:hypothetical protein